jgi:hypothetical protein
MVRLDALDPHVSGEHRAGDDDRNLLLETKQREEPLRLRQVPDRDRQMVEANHRAGDVLIKRTTSTPDGDISVLGGL